MHIPDLTLSSNNSGKLGDKETANRTSPTEYKKENLGLTMNIMTHQ